MCTQDHLLEQKTYQMCLALSRESVRWLKQKHWGPCVFLVHVVFMCCFGVSFDWRHEELHEDLETLHALALEGLLCRGTGVV